MAGAGVMFATFASVRKGLARCSRCFFCNGCNAAECAPRRSCLGMRRMCRNVCERLQCWERRLFAWLQMPCAFAVLRVRTIAYRFFFGALCTSRVVHASRRQGLHRVPRVSSLQGLNNKNATRLVLPQTHLCYVCNDGRANLFVLPRAALALFNTLLC